MAMILLTAPANRCPLAFLVEVLVLWVLVEDDSTDLALEMRRVVQDVLQLLRLVLVFLLEIHLILVAPLGAEFLLGGPLDDLLDEDLELGREVRGERVLVVFLERDLRLRAQGLCVLVIVRPFSFMFFMFRVGCRPSLGVGARLCLPFGSFLLCLEYV